MKTIFAKKPKAIFAVLTVIMLLTFALPITSASAAADTCTWTGTTDGDWNDATNWTGCDNGNIPENGDILVFPNGPTNKTLNNDIASLDLDSIQISGNGYIISGNSVELSPVSSTAINFGGSNNNLAMTTTITSSSTSKSISSSGANNVISAGLVLNLTGGSDMNIGSSGLDTLTIAGPISGTTQNFIISNGGTVAYNNASTFIATSNLQINDDSTVSCGDDACLGDSTNNLAIYGNGKFITSGVRGLPYDISTNPSTGDPTIEATDALTLTGALDINTDTTLSETNAGYKIVTASSGGIDVAPGATLNLVGDGTFLDSTFSIDGLVNSGDVSIINGEIYLGNNTGYDGDIIAQTDGFLGSTTQAGLGTTTGGVIIRDGAVLRNGFGAAITLDDDITIEGNGNVNDFYTEAAIYNEGADLTFTGDITLTGDTTVLNLADTNQIVFSGSITGTGDLTFNGDATNGGITLNGTTPNNYIGDTNIYSVNVTASKSDNVVAIPGDAYVTAIPAHTARIFTTNDEQIVDDAVIALDSDASLGALVVSGSSTETVGSITGDGYIQLGTVNDTLRVGGGNKSGTFTGQITGTGGANVSKIGTGIWNFQGVNNDLGSGFATYQVSGGTLSVNPADSSLVSSNVVVNSGGTLKGTGSVGPTTVNSGGTLSTGNSPGCLTLSTLTLNSGSTFVQEIDGGTVCSGYDRTTVSGAANLGGATLDVALGTNPPVGTEFTIVQAASVSGTFSGLSNGAVFLENGIRFRINYTSTTVTLTVVAADTPVTATTGTSGSLPATGFGITQIFFISVIVMLSIGLLLAISFRRKKRIKISFV